MSDSNEAQTQSQKIKLLMKQIEQWVAKKSFDGAIKFLDTQYVQSLLDKGQIEKCLSKVKYAEAEYKKTGKRLYWEWWIIFFIVSVVAAVVIYKYGIIGTVMEYFGFVASCARFIIGGIITFITALISSLFGYLGNCVDQLVRYIFS